MFTQYIWLSIVFIVVNNWYIKSAAELVASCEAMQNVCFYLEGMSDYQSGRVSK